jgi:PAS domain S-box-containing protein
MRAKAALRGCIEKPINPDTFANGIGKHLEGRPSRRGPAVNILVVDDDEQNCRLLQVLLARKGNAVVTAANGAEALEKARLNPPDLIITDILMPAMDGFSLCREWKQDERLRDIPLIFYTGAYADERDREFALGLGAARLIVKPEDLDNLLRTIQAVMAEQERGRLAVSPKTMQGDVVYLKEYNELLIRKLEDKMRQLEQTNRELERDITERKRAEEALRESEIRFRELFDNINSGVAVYEAVENGADFVLKDFNRTGQRIEQKSKQEVLGRRATEMFPGIREMGLLEVFQRVWRTGQPEHHPATLYRDERMVGWRENYVYKLPSGEVVTVYDDVTARRNAGEDLRRSETKFRTLYDSTSDAVMLLDLKEFFDCNQAALAIFGCATREEFCSKHPADVSPPMQPCGTDSLTLANRHIATAMEQGSHHFEWMHKRADTGETFPADVLLSAMELDGKRVLQAVVRNITRRKRAEEDLRSSQEQFRALAARIEQVREEERAALARELHDELGQGLTALQIDLAWLDGHLRTAGPADMPALRDKIAVMVPGAERLIETTQAISSTMRPGVLDDLGLVAAIEWLAADFEKRTGLACIATLPATDIALDLGFAVAVFRIVQEALTNVIRHAKATRVEIRLRATEGELALEVEDDGRGITPQQIADPRSLGLFSMRERAAALGGTVDFRSEAGRGTTVSVRMPVGGEGNG